MLHVFEVKKLEEARNDEWLWETKSVADFVPETDAVSATEIGSNSATEFAHERR